MTLHDFDPDELDLLIDLLRAVQFDTITTSQSHKAEHSLAKLIVLPENELREGVA